LFLSKGDIMLFFKIAVKEFYETLNGMLGNFKTGFSPIQEVARVEIIPENNIKISIANDFFILEKFLRIKELTRTEGIFLFTIEIQYLKKLLKLVKGKGEEDIEFTINGKSVVIVIGKAEYLLPINFGEEYEAWYNITVPEEKQFSLNQEQIQDLINFPRFAMGTDSFDISTYSINLCREENQNILKSRATNKFILGVSEVEVSNFHNEEPFSILIPRESIDTFIQQKENFWVNISGKHILFFNELGTRMQSVIMQDGIIPYEALINRERPYMFGIYRREIVNAISSVLLMSDKSDNIKTKFSKANGDVVFNMVSQSVKAMHKVPIIFLGEHEVIDFSLEFSSKFLLKVFENFEEEILYFSYEKPNEQNGSSTFCIKEKDSYDSKVAYIMGIGVNS